MALSKLYVKSQAKVLKKLKAIVDGAPSVIERCAAAEAQKKSS